MKNVSVFYRTASRLDCAASAISLALSLCAVPLPLLAYAGKAAAAIAGAAAAVSLLSYSYLMGRRFRASRAQKLYIALWAASSWLLAMVAAWAAK